MSTLSALQWRYSIKHFSNRRVPKQHIHNIIEAARLSASSYGLQPYQVWIIEDPEILSQLSKHAFNQPQLRECSHLLVLANQTNITDQIVDQYFERYYEQTQHKIGSLAGYADHIKSAIAAKNHQERQVWAQQQAYIALGSLLTEAAMLGVDTCPMTGFDNLAFNQVLKFEQKKLNACVICAVGYREASYEPPGKVRIPSQDFAKFIA